MSLTTVQRGGHARACALLLTLLITATATAARIDAGESLALNEVTPTPSALLAVDQHRTTVVERIVSEWGDKLTATGAGINREQLREMLFAMRADQLLAASLAGSLNGLRDVVAQALVAPTGAKGVAVAKALGDPGTDVVYVPVTPCRLVDTRAPYPAVFQNAGPFAAGEIRSYIVQSGNGVCLSQMPGGINPAAVQLQVFGIPANGVSGDIEVLPQGSAFGSSATLVYLGNNLFTSASTTARINQANNQISVQVRTGVANVAMDVVGYFRAPPGGYVASVTQGAGISVGGTALNPTVAVASGYQLPQACTNGQTPKSNGAGGWTCGSDFNSGGTVTSVGTGTGLTGGPITGSGTIGLATTQLLPSAQCTTNQIPKWNGSAWACAPDTGSSGTVTSITAGAGLTGGTITASGTIAVDPASTTLTTNFFKQGGNSFLAPAHFGTNDNNSVEIYANASRVMRYEPTAFSPNIVGGHPNNSAAIGKVGQTIAGGGETGNDCYEPSTGTSTRSCGNRTAAFYATVSGGFNNSASGDNSTVGGGYANTASGFDSVVAGGASNIASGNASTVGGGYLNTASGYSSFAAGSRAKTQTAGTPPIIHDGAFAWADDHDFDFNSTAPNEFAARATGGVRFVLGINVSTGAPTWTCSVVSGGSWACSSDRHQKQNLRQLDGRAVLAQLATMPIYSWNPKGENAHLRHFGPTAQDFYAAFGLGDSELRIGQQDADGVALAAIQGLNAKLEAKLAEKDREIAELRRAVEVLMARTSPEGRVAQAQ